MSKSNTWNSVPKRAQVLFAAECANKALHIYEQRYPNDNRSRKAVEAAFDYALHNKPINQKIIDDAYAAAAYAAADAAYAAADAAYNNVIAIYWASHATGINFDLLQQKVIGKTKFNPNWKTTHTLGIAKQIWHNKQLGNLPILADVLEEAGCDTDLIDYMRKDEEQTLADFFLWNLNLE